MPVLNPYLNFPGNTEEAFNFYKSVFGGEFSTFVRFKDTPEGGKMSAEDGEKMMHVALPIGGTTMMATDALESMGQKVTNGNSMTLSLHADSREEADKLYSGISAGGNAVMPMSDTFWGSYWGMCFDKYGIQWMVSYDAPAQKS